MLMAAVSERIKLLYPIENVTSFNLEYSSDTLFASVRLSRANDRDHD
jgi:hypothetical protein